MAENIPEAVPSDDDGAWSGLEIAAEGPSLAGALKPPASPKTEPPGRRTEAELRAILTEHDIQSRRFILRSLALGIGGVLLGVGFMLSRGTLSADQAKELLAVVLAPLFTLAGTALAFFFRNS